MSVPKHLTQSEWEIIKMSYETTIPNWLMKRTDISATAKLFGGFIHSVTAGGGWMLLEDEFIEELSGLDQIDVINGWSELNKFGLLEHDIYTNNSRCMRLKRG